MLWNLNRSDSMGQVLLKLFNPYSPHEDVILLCESC